ncbi:PD40 domain-containing protein, partial [bacterium]|nr:PD40 domain-containing protein [bacterium]
YLAQHANAGPGLCVLTDWKTAPKSTSLLGGELPLGDVNHPTLSFDAKKVIFAYCCLSKDKAERAKHPGGFFIYEAATNGSAVRQLTGTAADKKETAGNRSCCEIEDFDPCYLPDGRIVFTSTRSQNYGRCHGGRYTPAYLLYRAEADGSNITPISFGEANEHFPSVLNDGRIVFTRWEYNNRNQIALHKLWALRPDGTGVANFYGVNSATPWAGNYHDARGKGWYDHIPEEQRKQILPYMISETRAIAGSRTVVATATTHHSYTAGALILIDPDKGEDGFEPLKKLTPETHYPEAGGWKQPGNFMTPAPVNETLFFAAYSPNWIQKQHTTPLTWGYGIVLVDTLGGREPIYRDPVISTVSPLPIVPRTTPPVIASQLDQVATTDTGTLVVQNVHLTRNDPKGEIAKGDIKALRVIEMISLGRRGSRWAGEREDFARKILGAVPVNADGSAIFNVPAKKTLYLQALDKNGMALLTLRSLFHVMPGEKRSCIGCHEPIGTPPVEKFQAMNEKPRELIPPVGQDYPGGFSFMRTVQPVFDRHCIACHGLDKTDGKVNLLSHKPGRPADLRYGRNPKNGGWAYTHNTSDSWQSIVTRPGFVKVAIRKSNFSAEAETVNSVPKDFFGHAGKLLPLLLKGHEKVKLGRDDFQRIADWADMNYIRYGDYETRDKPEWNVPPKGTEAALRAAVKARFGDKIAGQPIQALVNVAQPDESRILKAPLALAGGGWGQLTPAWESTDDPTCKKMLALVLECAKGKKK